MIEARRESLFCHARGLEAVAPWRALADAWPPPGPVMRGRASHPYPTCPRFPLNPHARLPPQADLWCKYAEVELGSGNLSGLKAIFQRCLMAVPSVELWALYMKFIRRSNKGAGFGRAQGPVLHGVRLALAPPGGTHEQHWLWLKGAPLSVDASRPA